MSTSLLFALILSAASVQATAPPPCHAYDDRLTLEGTLQRRTYAGPPGYESVQDGDTPETGFYLVLPSPLCMAGDEADVTAQPLRDVTLVQLVLDGAGYRRLRSRLGSRVRLSGMPFSWHTGHHHAPVLLSKVREESR